MLVGAILINTYPINAITIPFGHKVIYSPSRETCAKYWRQGKQGYVYLTSPDIGFFNSVAVKQIVEESKRGGEEYAVIPKSPFFFSVANPYDTDKYWIIVFAQHISEAIKIAHAKYGCSSRDVHTHAEFKEKYAEIDFILDILD